MSNQGLLVYKDIAKRFNVHENTPRKWVMEHKIPFIRINRNIYFDPADIDAWVESKKVPVQNQGGEHV